MSDEVDALLASYEHSLTRIAALPELPMRQAAIGETIDKLEPDQAAWWIDQLLRGALWGRQREIDAMMACAFWLLKQREEGPYDRLEALYRASAEADRQTVLMVLRDPPPHRALRKGARLPEIALPMDRDVSVGERRSLATRNDRNILQRLLLDPNPLVIAKLLQNPHLSPQDILVVATRRPTTPEQLILVARSHRWIREYVVREALVRNPYAPTGMALKLLPTMKIQTLRRIDQAGDLHEVVHEFAGLLVKIREERTAPWRV